MNESIVIKFKDYVIDNFSYQMNESFKAKDDDQKFSVVFSVKSVINILDDSTNVTLMADIGRKDDEDCPFLIKAQITGIFEVTGEGEIEYEQLAPNLVSIIFPYLRSLVSSISNQNYIFPNYNIPIVNIYKMMEESGFIEIIDSRDSQ